MPMDAGESWRASWRFGSITPSARAAEVRIRPDAMRERAAVWRIAGLANRPKNSRIHLAVSHNRFYPLRCPFHLSMVWHEVHLTDARHTWLGQAQRQVSPEASGHS